MTPEFIHIFLGEKWLPMQLTFQLMLLYTLLDPILLLVTQLVTAVGQPQLLTRVQLWQMLFFVPAVIIASRWFGIEGVAVVADLMLLLGIVLLLPRLRHFVDFSLWQLLFVPSLAVIVGLPLTLLFIAWLPALHPAVTFMQKGLVLSVIFLLFLIVFERTQLQKSTDLLLDLLNKKKADA